MTHANQKITLGLGTAQFGSDYGITNTHGKVSIQQVRAIVDFASKNEINTVDTAALYGGSETVLGRSLSSDHGFRVVTKTVQLKKQEITVADIILMSETFKRSLEKLGQSSVYGLLIHNADDLLAQNGSMVFDLLESLKESKHVKKIGVSVYSGEQIDRLVELFDIDLVQLPLNILDQRLIHSGHLSRLAKRGIEIHARSVFLQGLLLTPPTKLHPYFNPISDRVTRLQSAFSESRMTSLEGSLSFIKNIPEIDCVIVGVSSLDELKQIHSAFHSLTTPQIDYTQYACEDEQMVNASLWRLS
ncbi:MAG: aldo/keto reductase [candidate division Zixibacteria bacterium]|nr:aldo/keto reductase [candidate division Zixibacteria bacterium]